MRLLGVTLTVAALSALSGFPAWAARATLHVRPSVVYPGGKVRASGNARGCPAGDQVFILSRAFPGHVFAGWGGLVTKVHAGGAFAVSGHVRRHAKKGLYEVTARCGGGNLGVTAHIRVR